MNGSDVWGSSAPYGDVLPLFKWNIYISLFIFSQAYFWNHGASVTCVNDENLKFWLRHRKEKLLISLVISFYHDRIKISPRMFYYACFFFSTKKNLFCNTWKFCKLCYHGHNTFYVFPSSFLHSMEKMSQFLIFLSILSYSYFLIQLVFS